MMEDGGFATAGAFACRPVHADMKQPELVTASQAELNDILARTKAVLPEQQYKLLEGILRTFAFF